MDINVFEASVKISRAFPSNSNSLTLQIYSYDADPVAITLYFGDNREQYDVLMATLPKTKDFYVCPPVKDEAA